MQAVEFRSFIFPLSVGQSVAFVPKEGSADVFEAGWETVSTRRLNGGNVELIQMRRCDAEGLGSDEGSDA